MYAESDDARDESLEIITSQNSRIALLKDETRHLRIRASLVGDYIYNTELAVIDVGTVDSGSRFMVPKAKAKAIVRAMNEILDKREG